MIQPNAQILVLISCWLAAACAPGEPIRSGPSSRTQPRSPVTSAPAPTSEKKEAKVPEITSREWSYRDGRAFQDRNGDGIVDWEAAGEERQTDGFGIYKEDNDFDGFYEREYVAGGVAYTVKSEKAIREPVSQIHRVYPPTSVTRKPKPEQSRGGNSAPLQTSP